MVWRKSSFCDNGNCVEVARTADGVAMRNSQLPGDELHMEADQWRGLLAALRTGRFR